jgi:hypothetical protein
MNLAGCEVVAKIDHRSVYRAFMGPRVIAILAMVLLLPLSSGAQQAGSKPAGGGSAYVVVWPASKEFHTPSCPLIKDAKGVSVLTRAQASGKGYKQHKDCDPATIAEANAPTMVYVAESDKVYHRADCKVLPKDAKKVVLDEKAVKGRWPCTVCRPPIRTAGPKAFNR